MNRAKQFFFGWAVLLGMVAIASCSSKQTTPYDKTKHGKTKIYSGTLSVGADAGLESVMRQQVEIFTFSQDSITVDISYKNTEELIDDLRTGRSTVVMLTRFLTEAEKKNLIEKDTFYIRETTVAYDAVALIGNPAFDDSKLSMGLLKGYFNPSNSSVESPKMVFDNQKSGTVYEVLTKLGYTQGKVSANVYALKSIEEVIAYVEGNKNAIGFIPFNFVSDTDNERVKKTLKRIKILSLQPENGKSADRNVSANQSDIAEGTYPLIQTVNAVTRYGHRDDLDWLFVNFLYQERGSRIFLKAGLVPAKMAEREINVNMEPVKGGD